MVVARALCEVVASSLVAPAERRHGRVTTAVLGVAVCAGCALCIVLLPLPLSKGGASSGVGAGGGTPFVGLHTALFLLCISSLRLAEVTTRALGSTVLPAAWEARAFGLLFIGSSAGGCLGSIVGTRLYAETGGETYPLGLGIFLLVATGGVLVTTGRGGRPGG